MGKLLNVAFVWHMHQPYYGNDSYTFPWVRVHAIKDYADMVAILKDYPHLHLTFNLTPCLLRQIQDHGQGDVEDVYWQMTMKRADTLTPSEKLFIVKRFCNPIWYKRISPYPRYLDLCKRIEFLTTLSPTAAIEILTQQDMLDLQIWFNLSWFDPFWIETDEKLQSLVNKGRNFKEEDKMVIAQKQKEIIKRIISLYKEARERGQVEVTTSPYYHPILPLLSNINIARLAMPQIVFPMRQFAFPEDVKEQIKMGIDCYQNHFGELPRGLWPPELAVGEDILSMVGGSDISWLISDEGILAKSLGIEISRHGIGHVNEPKVLYRAYRIERKGFSLAIVFRDRVLSDLISFTYSSWSPEDAARDLVRRLNHIQTALGDKSSEHLVTIALDGENCWEFYENDGHQFLHTLYGLLEKSQTLRTVTISEYLAENPPKEELSWLYTGSWIGANLRDWIGDPMQAKAWDILSETRSFLSRFKEHRSKKCEETWKMSLNEVYIAEGSDWFWWFSDLHRSEFNDIWDSQFRQHLRRVYKLLDKPVPHDLFRPIREKPSLSPVVYPLGSICPEIDGKVTDNEWIFAGYYDFSTLMGTQSWTEKVIERVYYGWDYENLYLRMDTHFSPDEFEISNIWFELYFSHPRKEPLNSSCPYWGLHSNTGELGFGLAYRMELKFSPNGIVAFLSSAKGENKWEGKRELKDVAKGECIELKIPFSDLELKSGDRLDFALILIKEGIELERAPKEGTISIAVP